MLYPPIVHNWTLKPKGPARRLTGEEVALLVLGTDDGGSWLGIALRKEGERLEPKPAKWGTRL